MSFPISKILPYQVGFGGGFVFLLLASFCRWLDPVISPDGALYLQIVEVWQREGSYQAMLTYLGGVLFSGVSGGEIPQWIAQHQIGDELGEHTAEWLEKMIKDPDLIYEMQKNAFDSYKAHFSRKIVSRRWQELLQ